MNINTNQFTTAKTARYSTLGNGPETAKYFWFVLHGSKMTCEQMLYKFSEFDPDEHFIVAPEGLNRFYANGFGGDVVASWMTSRDRLSEIDDFSNYLTKLYKSYSSKLSKDCKKMILGFSQGGTTMYRWLHARKIETDIVLPYACWIPEDIDLQESKTRLNQAKTIYSYGLEDQYLNYDIITKVKRIIQKNELNIDIESYTGDHRLDRDHLSKLFNSYIKRE